jgi:hypothetical protein
MLLHQKLADHANCIKGIDVEIEHSEDMCARHHHQTMLGIGCEVNIGDGGSMMSTHANLPNSDVRGGTSELSRFS